MNTQSYFDNWDSTVPDYGAAPILIPNIGAYIDVGTTIIYYTHDIISNNQTVHVGTIVKYDDPVILVNAYDDFHCSLPSQRHSSIFIGRDVDVKEVFQTLKQDTIYIYNIIDICFIFHNSLFDKGLSFCQGIDNAFTIRFRYDYKTNKIASVVADTYITFPSISKDHYKGSACYLSTIWNGISRIQDQLGILLNRRSQRQLTFVYHREDLFVEADLWQYLLSHFSRIKLPVLTKGKRVGSRLVTNNNFNRERFSIEGNVTTFRFRTVNDIFMFSRILGNTCTIGTRNIKPKLNCTDFVSNGHVINVIGGIHNIDDKSYKRSKYGIDIHCKVNSFNLHQMFIVVRCKGIRRASKETCLRISHVS
jgi:hypothetical protein